MKLYYGKFTRALRPRWILEELGVPYELVRLDMEEGEHKTDAHLARHPLGKVPVLEDGGVTMYESAGIVAYIADRYGDDAMAPPVDSPERGRYYQWLFYAMLHLEPHVAAVSRQRRGADGDEDTALVEQESERFSKAAAAIEEELADKEFLFGRFGAADIVVGAVVIWARSAKLLEGFPRLTDYANRLKAREAFRTAVLK